MLQLKDSCHNENWVQPQKRFKKCTAHKNIYDRHQYESEISSDILGLVGPSRGQQGHPSASSNFKAKVL